MCLPQWHAMSLKFSLRNNFFPISTDLIAIFWQCGFRSETISAVINDLFILDLPFNCRFVYAYFSIIFQNRHNIKISCHLFINTLILITDLFRMEIPTKNETKLHIETELLLFRCEKRNYHQIFSELNWLFEKFRRAIIVLLFSKRLYIQRRTKNET